MNIVRRMLPVAIAMLWSLTLLMAQGPVKVSESIYMVGGSCNVFAVVRDGAALLIDSGEGDILNCLDDLGVKRVEWVLQTHAHRDQCAATVKLAELGARVAVLDQGERFYRDPAGFWNGYQLYIRYQFKPDNFKPANPIPVDRVLTDGDTLQWRGITFTALATPGHSVDHTAWLAEIDGRKVAFTGDMIHSPGKVWNLYHFDYRYWDGGFEGVTKTLAGLDKVLAWGADLLLPSHGTPMDNPAGAVALLKENMGGLYEFQAPDEDGEEETPAPRTQAEPPLIRQVSEHLYHVRPTGYVLLDGHGGALFYDYYSVPEPDERWGPGRIDTLIKTLNIQRVEVAIPSHFHEDHIRGFPVLKDKFGTQFWIFEPMADLFAHPSAYNLCCVAPEVIPADRVLHDNELISWGPYTFRIMHFPGQTMYHQAMYGEVDGRRVMFMGDSDCYALGDPTMGRRNARLHGISTFFNYYNLDPGRGYEKALERLVQYNPEVLLMAHSGPREANLLTYQTNLDSIRTRRARVEKVLSFEDPNLGFDPNWASFYPYSAAPDSNGSIDAELRIRNHLTHPLTAKIELRLPPGWRAEPATSTLTVPGKGQDASRFRIIVPAGETFTGRKVVTARIKAAGYDWGEFCEMLVEGGE